MRNSRGFTLIELVIVIVILGILGAVAAPRFINMQGDAYKANLEALKGSVEGAAILGHTKAILNGYDNIEYVLSDSSNNFKRSKRFEPGDERDIVFSFGYPAASGDGIIRMLQSSDTFSSDKGTRFQYTHRDGDNTRMIIALDARHIYPEGEPIESKKCELTYQHPKKLGDVPKVTLYTKGC